MRNNTNLPADPFRISRSRPVIRQHREVPLQRLAPRLISTTNRDREKGCFQQSFNFFQSHQVSPTKSYKHSNQSYLNTKQNLDDINKWAQYQQLTRASEFFSSSVKAEHPLHKQPSSIFTQQIGTKDPRAKARNIVLVGLDFTQGDPKVCAGNVLNNLAVDYEIDGFKVLKANNTLQSVCLVTLKTVQQKTDILRNKWKLKNSPVVIRDDLTNEERANVKLSIDSYTCKQLQHSMVEQASDSNKTRRREQSDPNLTRSVDPVKNFHVDIRKEHKRVYLVNKKRGDESLARKCNTAKQLKQNGVELASKSDKTRNSEKRDRNIMPSLEPGMRKDKHEKIFTSFEQIQGDILTWWS